MTKTRKTVPGLTRPRWVYSAIFTGFAACAIGAAVEAIHVLVTGHLW